MARAIMNSSRLLHWLRVSSQIVRLCHFGEQKELFLIGVPFSGGQPKQGVEYAPAHLRKHGLIGTINKLGYKISDFGELKIPLTDPEDHNYITSRDTGTSVKNALECGSVARKLSHEITRATKDGKLSLTIGGDHSISVGTVFGHASVRKNTCLLWIDAHMDINTPSTTITGNLHGMPLSMLIRGVTESPPLAGYKWCSPCLSPQDVAYIGLRDVDPPET